MWSSLFSDSFVSTTYLEERDVSLITQIWSQCEGLLLISYNITPLPAGFSTWKASGQLKSSLFTTKLHCLIIKAIREIVPRPVQPDLTWTWMFLGQFYVGSAQCWNPCCCSGGEGQSWCFLPAVSSLCSQSEVFHNLMLVWSSADWGRPVCWPSWSPACRNFAIKIFPNFLHWRTVCCPWVALSYFMPVKQDSTQQLLYNMN